MPTLTVALQDAAVPCAAAAEGHEHDLFRRYGKFVQDLELLQRTWVFDPVWLCMVRIAEWLRFSNDLEEAIINEVLRPPYRQNFPSWRPDKWFTFSVPQRQIWWRVAGISIVGAECSKSEVLYWLKRLLMLDPDSEALLYAQLMFANSSAPICTLLGPGPSLAEQSPQLNDPMVNEVLLMRVLPLLNSEEKRNLRLAHRAYKAAHDKLMLRLEANIVPADIATLFPDLQEVIMRDRDMLTLDEDVLAPLHWLVHCSHGILDGIKMLAPAILQAVNDFPHLWLVLGGAGGTAKLSQIISMLKRVKSGCSVLEVAELSFGGVTSLKVSTAEMVALSQLRHLRIFNDGWAGVQHLQDLTMLSTVTQLKVTLEHLEQLPELNAVAAQLPDLKALHVRYQPASVKQQQALADRDIPPPLPPPQQHNHNALDNTAPPTMPPVDAELVAAVKCCEAQPALTGLSFWQLGLDDAESLASLRRLTQLSTLYLSLHSAAVPESVMSAMVSPLSNLSSLTLSDIWSRGNDDSEISADLCEALPRLQALTHLHMCGNRVAFALPLVQAITQLRSLSVLEVHHCGIWQDFTKLAALTQLQALDCSDCWLASFLAPSDFYATIRALTGLTSLDLSSCDALLAPQLMCECLASLPRLCNVDLSCSYEEAAGLRLSEQTIRWLVAVLHDVPSVRVGGQLPQGRLEDCYVQEHRCQMSMQYEAAVEDYIRHNPQGHPMLANKRLEIHTWDDGTASVDHVLVFDDRGRPVTDHEEDSPDHERGEAAEAATAADSQAITRQAEAGPSSSGGGGTPSVAPGGHAEGPGPAAGAGAVPGPGAGPAPMVEAAHPVGALAHVLQQLRLGLGIARSRS